MSDISTKLTYLQTTKQLLKTEINKINNVLDDNSTFRSYPQELFNGYLDILNNGTDTLWNNLEKVSASGEEATLENVETAPMKMVLNGNTSQETTSGKNLFNKDNEQKIVINPTTGTERYGIIIEAPNKKVSFSGTWLSDNNLAYKLINGETYGSYVSFNSPITIDVQDKILFYNGTENQKLSAIVDKIQIEIGTITPYEPYTGGQPSPNPDYPQQVKVVKGENVVSVQGKNRFTTDYLTSNNFTTYAKLSDNSFSFTATGTWKKATYNVPCKPNTDYYFNISSSSSMYIQIKGVQTGTQLLGKYSAYLFSFNSGENTELEINIGIGNTSIASETISDIQLEEGTTKTDFVPYSKTDYPINLGTLELCKINNYKDFPFKAINGNEYYDSLTEEQKNALVYGKWYVHKEIGKVVLDGSETWSIDGSTDDTITFKTYLSSRIKVSNLALCNILTRATGVTETFAWLASGGATYIKIYKTRASDVSSFKNWLSTNNAIIYYVLATPIEEEITNTTLIEQLEAISKAKSVKDKTYITQTNEELPFILDVEAIEEYEVN